MHIYEFGRNAIMSPRGRASLEVDYAEATGSDTSLLNNLEHECQVREAHITAKLAAFEAVRSPQKHLLDVCYEQAKDLLDYQPPEEPHPKPAAALHSHTTVSIPNKPEPKPIKSPAISPPVSAENLTTHMLRDVHDIAQKTKATSRASYSSAYCRSVLAHGKGR
ncbi:hypothetical protein [Aliiroseovarius sp. 2305UL8-7]|uniref:hypothetical protein n=1 Tax=Aliiroseovarius conchicola TaxID=3121637 RepID=UPI003526F002